MKVAILTMFNGLSSTYSLVNVVAEHLKMLLDAGKPLLNHNSGVVKVEESTLKFESRC